MKIALVSHGSSLSDALVHSELLARSVSARLGMPVEPVSWTRSPRVPAAATAGEPVVAWLRRQLSEGHRDFVFIPFFVCANGAIAKSLRDAIANVQAQRGDFSYAFTEGLQAPGLLGRLLSDRVNETLTGVGLRSPAVVVIDHGSPCEASAQLRQRVVHDVRAALQGRVRAVGGASLQGGGFEHNRPLLPDCLALSPFDHGEVVLAPIFLTAGRHAGHGGDLHHLAADAELRSGGRLKCHFIAPIARHPFVPEALAATVRTTLAALGARARAAAGGVSHGASNAPFPRRWHHRMVPTTPTREPSRGHKGPKPAPRSRILP